MGLKFELEPNYCVISSKVGCIDLKLFLLLKKLK